jgi:hypothetical protein
MKFNDKILIFLTQITNAYRGEENQEFTQQMTLDDENLTEDFTAMVFALNMFFNKVTGQNIDVIDFTHLMNKLVFQHLMDDHPTEKGGGSDV